MEQPHHRWHKTSSGVILPEGFESEVDDRLDEIVLRLPCYEPTNLTVHLSFREALKHIFIVGQTGSGKSSILNKVISDLIDYRSARTGERIGLLIIDSQGDHTVEHVRRLAAESGRADDVRIISPTGGSFNPFSDLTSFDGIESVSSKIISATKFAGESMPDSRDAYWTENTRKWIESGLAYLLIHKKEITVLDVLQFLSEIFLQPEWSPQTKAIIERVDKIIATTNYLSAGISAQLAMARATIHTLKQIDPRTKNILQSCLGITLRPFLATSALRYWDESKGEAVRPDQALEGKIIVVSTRAATEVETASLICKLVKMEFYASAQARKSLGKQAIAGIILDEFHYSATSGSPRWSDASNIATLRSKGIFMIAASQGLIQIDLKLGYGQTEALLINFSNLILLRSQEAGHLYNFAEKIFGFKPGRIIPAGQLDKIGDIFTARPEFHWVIPPEPVCPPGSLARLEPHQAYVFLANGFRTEEPIWLAPLFLSDPSEESIVYTDLALQSIRRTANELQNLRKKPSSATEYYSQDLWKFLLNASPRQIKALQVMTLAEFKSSLKGLGRDPSGLETIPPAWRMACFRLARQQSRHVRLVKLAEKDGRLDVSFVPWSKKTEAAELTKLENKWRLSVYPTVLRPLRIQDQRWLRTHFPHLCAHFVQTKKS